MRKLNLKIEDLAVVSFETTSEAATITTKRRTVRAHQASPSSMCTETEGYCCPPTAAWLYTCQTCPGQNTCGETCAASCRNTDCPGFCGGGQGNLCAQSASCIEGTEFYTGPVL